MTTPDPSRRTFIKQMGGATAAATLFSGSRFAMAGDAKRTFNVGVFAAGGRARGAMGNLRDAADLVGVEVKFVAIADVFQDKVDRAGEQYDVPPENRFAGFDGYRKVLDRPLDIVLMATPPNFRPLHFESAVAAGCHCFIEKPVAVDAPGARRMYAIGKEAADKGLTVVAGTQRRHTGDYLANAQAIHDGAIGAITGGRIQWLTSALWVRDRSDGQSNAEYLANNWVNFNEMSGDHIVEQHMHNIDVANWFIGRVPRTALGFGGRARRRSGNQYDFFSVDFDYGDDCGIHSMSRQINNTYGRVGESLVGTEGRIVGGAGRIERFDGRDVHRPDISLLSGRGMVQEHVAMLQSILAEEGLNETKHVTDATMTAIMGRIAAYTGQIVRWSDVAENEESEWYNLALSPSAEAFEEGEVELPEEEVAPIPGEA